MKTLFAAMILATLMLATGAKAHALEFSRHIASSDTFVTTYAPRLDEAGAPTGFYVERHYDFALNRLTERYYGDSSVQITTMKFSDFDRSDGSNHIVDTIRPTACEAAKAEQEKSKDAVAFLKLVCGAAP